MSAEREKDSSDFDLETFVDLFDTAMTSDNPAVQKAFKNLLMIAAIVNSDVKQDVPAGPLSRLVDEVRNLNRRISDLENQKMIPGGGYIPPTSVPVPMPTYPTGPTWVSPNTTTPWPPGSITCSTNYDENFINSLGKETKTNLI